MTHRITLASVGAMLWLLLALTTQGASIKGTVVAQAAQAPGAGEAGKYDSRKFKFAEKVDYASLRDFVVYIQGPLEGTALEPSSSSRPVVHRIVQKGATFLPQTLPVLVGSTVEWPNEDEIFHNVFSISAPKEFDLGLYKKPELKRVTFDKPGRVDIFCSIHTAMNCTILVLENPFFAMTNDRGHYVIPNVPAGTYQLRAWHERLPTQRRTITLKPTEDLKVDFILGPGAPSQP